MLRRFNYTGRARLLREDVRFSLKNEASGWSSSSGPTITHSSSFRQPCGPA